MRFGKGRGIAPLLAFTLTAVIATGLVATASVRAGLICHTIPREVVAIDVHTGGEFFAPPVPNGMYTKDCLGAAAKACGLVTGAVSGLLHGCCPACGGHGDGCNECGGTGKCGHFGGCGVPALAHDDGCGETVVPGCGFGGWKAMLHGCPDPGIACGGGICPPQLPVKSCGFMGKSSTICTGMPASIATPQAHCGLGNGVCGVPSMMCSKPGCLLKMRHFHKIGNGCNACNGVGCGICHGGKMLSGSLCGDCGGGGCGKCSGLGLHKGGGLCSACGGKGCGLCCGLGSKALGLLGGLFGVGGIEYFVGPGGPVPLTPGYVPYVVTTRSPRDFFAFPPFSQIDP